MYVPKAFAVEDLAELQDFMEQFNFATLVTQRDGDLTASHIPFLLDRSVEPYGVLRAHVAIRNPQLRDLRSGSPALVIFQGPHSYISPSWYVKPENVPTWNYTAVHAYGVPKIGDQAATIALLKDLVEITRRLSNCHGTSIRTRRGYRSSFLKSPVSKSGSKSCKGSSS